jgi:Flp pilus assembly protein TadG
VRRSGRDRERGASLVEFALLLPLFSLLLFGTITGGLTLTRQNSVENAVREGTRFGAVNPLGDPVDVPNYLGQVLDQAKAAATGDLRDGVAGKTICAAFVQENGTITSLEENSAGTRSAGTALCFADGRSDERVQVQASRQSDIDGVIYRQTVTLSSRSVTRYER